MQQCSFHSEAKLMRCRFQMLLLLQLSVSTAICRPTIIHLITSLAASPLGHTYTRMSPFLKHTYRQTDVLVSPKAWHKPFIEGYQERIIWLGRPKRTTIHSQQLFVASHLCKSSATVLPVCVRFMFTVYANTLFINYSYRCNAFRTPLSPLLVQYYCYN